MKSMEDNNKAEFQHQPTILLYSCFSSKSGKTYGYEDGGEGQEGDMQFVRGNKAIRDHQKDGKSLYLFEYVDRGYVRFIGEMVCWKIHEKSGLDIKGRLRKMIVFELKPAN